MSTTYKICPKCGAQMKVRENVMTSSMPPMHIYDCPNCGEVEFDTILYPCDLGELATQSKNEVDLCDKTDYKKKYEDALERAKKLRDKLKYSSSSDAAMTVTELEEIFPQLAESEDERIRKEIIDIVEAYRANCVYEGTHRFDDCLAYLEKQKGPEDKGEISDGYHTFNELYYYRMLYNAAFFNLLPKDLVHKSKKHHDGEECFGGGWFIVMANLPTGQISNHYELKDWDLFQIPEKEIADEWDGHTPQEAAQRLHEYLLEKKKEQKPVEWNPTNEDVVLFNKAITTNTALTPAERAKLDIIRMKFKHCNGNIANQAEWNEKPCLTCDEYDKGYKQGYTEGCTAGYNKAMLEQKPAGWDEYTKMNLDRALQIVKEAKGTLQGYQSDDGIYECDKAIECLEHFLYPGFEIKKSAEWSEEDNIGWDEAFACVTRAEKAAKNEEELQNAVTAEKWLKEIKFKYYVHPVKQEWSEEDEKMLVAISKALGCDTAEKILENEGVTLLMAAGFLASLRPQPQGTYKQVIHTIFGMLKDKDFYEIQPSHRVSLLNDIRVKCKDAIECAPILDEPHWKPSEDDERLINTSISFLKDFADKGYENAVECIDWLKSKLSGNSGK